MKATSLEAYETMKPKIPTDHAIIMSVLTNTPMTYKEIGVKIRVKLISERKTTELQGWFDPNKVSRRMSELVELKKVEVCPSRICTVAKSNCTTYIKAVNEIEVSVEEIIKTPC